MKFVVKVTETLSRTVIVDANNTEDACRMVERAYRADRITIDPYEDYVGGYVGVLRKASGMDFESYDLICAEV